MVGDASWKADLELVRRVARNDATARDEFCERMECVAHYVVALHARSRLRLTDEELLDSIQEVHLSIWKSLSNYEGRSRLESWVYGFCLNQLRRSQRRSRRPQPVLSPQAALAETVGPPGAMEILIDLLSQQGREEEARHYRQRLAAERPD